MSDRMADCSSKLKKIKAEKPWDDNTNGNDGSSNKVINTKIKVEKKSIPEEKNVSKLISVNSALKPSRVSRLLRKYEDSRKNLLTKQASIEQGIYDTETEIFRESGPYGNILNLFSDCSNVSGGRRRSIRSTEINPTQRIASFSSSTAILNVPELATQLNVRKVEREKEQSTSSGDNGVNLRQSKKRK